jgi:hypothetical protein
MKASYLLFAGLLACALGLMTGLYFAGEYLLIERLAGTRNGFPMLVSPLGWGLIAAFVLICERMGWEV